MPSIDDIVHTITPGRKVSLAQRLRTRTIQPLRTRDARDHCRDIVQSLTPEQAEGLLPAQSIRADIASSDAPRRLLSVPNLSRSSPMRKALLEGRDVKDVPGAIYRTKIESPAELGAPYDPERAGACRVRPRDWPQQGDLVRPARRP